MATSKNGYIGSGPESDKVIENMHAIEQLRIAVSAETEEIKKDNKEKFDEVSERLQSIESVISKISKSIDESTVPTNNTTNMASESEKRFTLKHVFENVKKFKKGLQNFSEMEEHFNVDSRMCLVRRNNHLGFYLQCKLIIPADKWSIQTKMELKIVHKNRDDVVKTTDYCYKTITGHGFPEFLEWEKMEKEYLVKGMLTVEAHVSIIETTGLAKEKIREFDESQKDISDVILVVRDTKFYVSKMVSTLTDLPYLSTIFQFLAAQSSVFRALLFGKFSESEQSEVTLNGIDPDDFHYFLEVLYGEPAVDDTTVEGVALLADMYDAPTAIRRCEEFLLKESKKKLAKKLEIATRYHLEKLQKKCMSDITSLEVFGRVPKNSNY
ncbi:hypothetical protein B9Z55_007721 [Caenorhabditis nigoni]|uniref:BTB domain-containing protein n=1 Tax=Caenorhabditis nigoni TaxID=1611254 RepID=A0A2G5VAW5_9PELO|nr:hypothetical protein B9Z55_007721 [Caenorhabditis nigoni]